MKLTLRTECRTANSTYPKVAVLWLNQALCFYQSLCLVDSAVLRNRHLRVAANRCSQFEDSMKQLLVLMTLFSLNSFGQKKDLFQQMIQGCLSDSTFKYTVLHDPNHKCIDSPAYNIPYRPVNYSGDLEFDLTFNGASLEEHNYSDSTKCSPFQISFLQKSKSRYEVSVSYIVFLPLSCEHLEGHGKNHGCFSKKVISMSRKIKIKRNGDWKIKDTQYGNRIMTGTYL